MRELRLAPESTRIDDTAWVAPNATVLGDVRLGAQVTVWYGSVIRGDVESIRVGARTNVQDLSVLHADEGFPCELGVGVTIGHRCIVHGAKVGDHALIGMGAVLMNGVEVGAESLVGAGALVPEGRTIPPRSLALGAPAKVVRTLTDEEVERLHLSAAHYVESGQAYRASGR